MDAALKACLTISGTGLLSAHGLKFPFVFLFHFVSTSAYENEAQYKVQVS